jgi:membrane associated rhomboid family serine protease
MFPIQNSVATRYPAVVSWCLIGANCAIFLFQYSVSSSELEAFLARYALIPARFFAYQDYGLEAPSPTDYLPFATNMFLHGGWLHLIFNMWTLWIFGPAVEDRMGRWRYLLFYVACGIAASATHAAFNASSAIPALGASGAIAGVIGCFTRMFPLARLVVVIPIVIIPFFFEMHALIFAGLWFLLQILQGTVELFAPSSGGGVAWWAHIGGFVAGVILVPALRRRRRNYRRYFPDEGIFGFTPDGRR